MKNIFKMWWNGVLILTGSTLGAYIYCVVLGMLIFGILTLLGVF